MFEAQACATPEAAAVTHGQEQLSYRELNARANQLARFLRVLGVSAETPIALYLDRSPLMVVAILGVLKAGGASFRDVVMLRAYFVHLARDLPVYRKVRKDYLSEPYPASTAVGVTELAIPGLEVEIEAVAIV